MDKQRLNKTLVIGIILLFVFMSINPSSAFNNVNKSSFPVSGGNTLYVGGNGPDNYTRIQDAIDNASSGDTIFVYTGIYHESIVINKTITLLGEDKNTTIIDSTNISDVSINITKNADEVTVSGFTIESDENYWGAISVYLISDNNTISDNIMRDYEGIVIEEYEKEVSCGNNISNNFISSWNFGIIIESSTNNVIRGNYISHEQCGAIIVEDSQENMIIDNQFINNYYGLTLSYSSNNVISGNVIQNTQESGISSHGIGNIICNNIISGNGDGGINLIFAKNHKVYHNHVVNNSFVGIGAAYSMGNKIYENNIFNNEMDARWANTPAEFLFLWRNRWYKNYWGSPRALPKPIFGFFYFGAIGNFPLSIPRFQYDLFPAQEPYDIEV